MPKKRPAPANQSHGDDKPADQPTTNCKCPLPPPKQKKVTLVELVEVVARSPEGTVTGAAPASGKLGNTASRTDKKGAAYKQFINLGKDIEGAAKRHPEYARYVEVKARVESTDGAHAGHEVKFTYEQVAKGKKRPASLTGAPAEGFGSAGGAATHTASTDAEGWTPTVGFYLSQYAGDQFKITAEATEDAGNKKQTGVYEVWRKFWYQVTRAQTHAVPAPSDSITAYETVCSDMIATNEATFTKADAPAGTFYPGWMVRIGNGDTEESVIGGHNRDEFYKKFVAEADKPVKGHLIICQHQWDPFGESALLTADITSNPSEELTLDLSGAWNAGIVKPALKDDLIVVAKWSAGSKTGDLAVSNILVEKSRTGLNKVKVSLPAGAPDPATEKVTVQLKLRYGKFYAGESNKHHMLIVYRGDQKAFNQVVSHEFGHGFGQTPRDGTQPAPLPKHPKQYSNEHGGVGSHCSTDVTEVDDTTVTSGKRYQGGTCIMFHQVNPSGCKQVFCDDCEPYIRLQDFSALK